MNQNTKQKRSAASWLAELAKGRYGEYALSVLTALLGVACSLIPYFIIIRLITALVNGTAELPPLPDALRMDGGLLGAALCAAQRVHLSLPPCDVPCAGQYPRPAAGQASDAAAGYGAGSFLRLV